MGGPVHKIKPFTLCSLGIRKKKGFFGRIPVLSNYLLLQGITPGIKSQGAHVLSVYLQARIVYDAAVYSASLGVYPQNFKFPPAICGYNALVNVTCSGHLKIFDHFYVQEAFFSGVTVFIDLRIRGDHLLSGNT